MKTCTPLCIAILLVTCILTAGCTGPQEQVPATVSTLPAGTAPPTQPPVPEVCPPPPGPTQVVPDYESVSITVDRNTISEDPTITTTFNGGLGLGMVQTMTVTLIRSDCTEDQQVRKDPRMGTSVTQMGTTGTDRVKVDLVMTSGIQYTVIDGLYPFPPKI